MEPMPSLHLAYSSMGLAATLAAGGADTTPSIACAVAGVFGGAITQCLTADERKPTRKVFVGEMLAAGVMGFAAYVWAESHDPSTILTAIGMGGGGSLAWAKLVARYQKFIGG